MENIKHFSDQFKHLRLRELHAVDELLDAEIASRQVHTDGGTQDPDNDSDNDGGLPDDPTHPD